MPTSAEFARAYCRRYGFALVPLPPKTKRPLADDWGKHVITDPERAFEFYTERPDWNMGVALGPSRLCSFDVDDIEATRAIFFEFGWSLDDLRDKYPTIQGRPDGFRVMFRVPEGVQLPYHALSWPKKDGGTGRSVIFEIRAAHEQQRQDVLPPSIHPDTNAPYVWLTKPKDGVIPEPPEFLLQVWKNWDALKPQFQSVCPWAPKPAPKPVRQPAAPREGASVIDTFNAAHGVEDMLTQFGYKQQGKRWLSPHSGTGLPGVTIMDGNKAWIHHASDPLCSDESGQPVGPFDLFCHYQHGGDVRKAVRQAAENLGMERKAPAVRPMQVVDPETGEIVTATPAMAGVMSRYQAVASFGLDANDKGVPFPSVANIVKVISLSEEFAGKIWIDEFLCRICTIWGSDEVREWSEVDDIKMQAFIQDWLGMPKLAKATVADAVMMVANMDRRNEAKAYIDGLTWDGIERLPHFFQDIFGVNESDYTRAAGSNFWLSLVARVMRPGCKVDTMIVLEGVQGAGKSKALSIIGGKWFAEATESPSSKDFYLNLQGKMLVEIGEMDAFNRAEVTKVKQVISCHTDRFRAPYDRRSADHPRRCVFAGTTNRDDWNKDETGARRFWPVCVVEVRHDLLIANRDQFFAEAAAKLSAGATWWDMPEDETRREQENRRDADELEPMLADWLIGKNETTVGAVMTDFMKIPIEKQDKQLQMRVSKALRGLKWKRPTSPAWRGGRLVRIWQRNGSAVADDEEGPF